MKIIEKSLNYDIVVKLHSGWSLNLTHKADICMQDFNEKKTFCNFIKGQGQSSNQKCILSFERNSKNHFLQSQIKLFAALCIILYVNIDVFLVIMVLYW